MSMEFTVYWKELLGEIVEIAQEVLADESFPALYHEDMLTTLKSAKDVARLIDDPSLINLSHQDVLNFSRQCRTQVSAIIGFPRIMLECPKLYENQILNDHLRAKIEHIKNFGRKLLGMINDVIDYHALLLEKLDLEFEAVDVNRSLESIEKLRQGKDTTSGKINIVCQNQPVIVLADSIRLRQLFLNLSLPLNSDVTITICKDMQTQQAKIVFDYEHLSLTIDDLKMRFIPSYALENNSLNLLIATHLVRQHKGNFETKLDDQSVTFTLYLPLANDTTS